jgi:hypothetical protein
MIYEENYHDSIYADERTVELRQRTIKTCLGADGGKVGKLNIH